MQTCFKLRYIHTYSKTILRPKKVENVPTYTKQKIDVVNKRQLFHIQSLQ